MLFLSLLVHSHRQSPCALVSQSSLRRHGANDPLGSPTESQDSSNESWRQALFGDGRSSPRSVGAAGAIEEEAFLHGAASEITEMAETPREDEEEAVECMNVKELKAKAAEVSVCGGGGGRLRMCM